jgi:hypothetical protein
VPLSFAIVHNRFEDRFQIVFVQIDFTNLQLGYEFVDLANGAVGQLLYGQRAFFTLARLVTLHLQKSQALLIENVYEFSLKILVLVPSSTGNRAIRFQIV